MVRDRLSPLKRPRKYIFVDELPRTSVGKSESSCSADASAHGGCHRQSAVTFTRAMSPVKTRAVQG